ncbi:MAG: ATP-binding protein [Candidatus Hodarchaeota archaeon]
MTNRPWFPTIYADQCDGCKGAYKCTHYCPNGVLEIRDDKAFVINPLRCIYGCFACATLCPKSAIMFPPRSEPYRLTKKKSLLHRVTCRDCGKHFSTDRETEYCFSCEVQHDI